MSFFHSESDFQGFSDFCAQILEEEGVLEDVTIRECPLYFIPFDDDVLSLELECSFKVLAVFLCRAVSLPFKVFYYHADPK